MGPFLPQPLPPLNDDERRQLREILYWIFLALAFAGLAIILALWLGRAYFDLSLPAGEVAAYLAIPIAYALVSAVFLAPVSWNWMQSYFDEQ